MNGINIIQNPSILIFNTNNNFVNFFTLLIFFLNHSELNIDDVGTGNLIQLQLIIVLLTLWPLDILRYAVSDF